MTRKVFATPLAALVLIAAAPVPSVAMASNANDQNSSTTASASSEDGAKEERKTCKTFKMSGSNMRSQRLCLTRAQWKEYYAAQEE